VRTHPPRTERPQQLLNPRMHRRHLRPAEQTPRHTRLVRHHPQPQPRRPQPIQRRPHPRQRPHLLRITVERHVLHQRPVPIQQHRVEQDRPGRGPVSTGTSPG
jgi:hypothetical protein